MRATICDFASAKAIRSTSISPGSNRLGRSIRHRKTEIKRGVGATEIRAKLVGTFAAYSRGLTPRYEMCRAVH